MLYLCLFGFVIISFLGNTELITYKNFYYFFKDLNTSFDSIDVYADESVTYSTDDQQVFVLYRNGLAVVGNHAVTIFTETGRQTVSQNIQYKNPAAEGAGKYLLVYELGGTQYSLYNSFTQLYSGESEYPIQGVAVSDRGAYALITSSEEYTSVVSLYNSYFSLINRYNKNGYVMDVEINDAGDQIAILSSQAKGGIFYTELLLHRPGADESEKRVLNIGNSLALRCSYTESGALGVVCTDGFSFVRDGRVESFFDFGERAIVSLDQSPNGTAVCLKKSVVSTENDLIVFDKNGKQLYNGTAPADAIQISLRGSVVFLLHSNGITRFDAKRDRITHYECATEQRVLLARGERDVLLCSGQKAEFIRISP